MIDWLSNTSITASGCGGGSMIFLSGAPTPKVGVLTYYFVKFLPKTAWKQKNLDTEGVRVPSAPIPWIRQWRGKMAFGSKALVATLLFDPSMSALHYETYIVQVLAIPSSLYCCYLVLYPAFKYTYIVKTVCTRMHFSRMHTDRCSGRH